MLSKVCELCGKKYTRESWIGRPKTFRQYRFCSKSCSFKRTWKDKKNREKLTLAKISENNPQWKGDNVGYSSLHCWVKYRKNRETICEECGEEKGYSLDLANISGEYKRDVKDWEWLCRLCHMKKDGRLEQLTARNKGVENESALLRLQRGRLHSNKPSRPKSG